MNRRTTYRRRSVPRLWQPPRERHNLADDLAQARCPVCRQVLVIRQGSRRPYFQCGCKPLAA